MPINQENINIKYEHNQGKYKYKNREKEVEKIQGLKLLSLIALVAKFGLFYSNILTWKKRNLNQESLGKF
jgi:ABC-type lipoprotein release transport system permease subunit